MAEFLEPLQENPNRPGDGSGDKKKKKNTPKKQLAFATDPKYRCRFYEAEYPELEEVVVVQVNAIKSMGAYVSLLEYDGIEGMVLLSELSRRRIRSINKLIRVNISTSHS